MFKGLESLKNRPRSRRPQVLRYDTIKKPFKNSCQRITILVQKKKILVSTVSRMRGNSLRQSREPLLSAATVQKMERNTSLLNGLKDHANRILIFSDKKTFTVDSVFSRQNERVVTFGYDV